MKFSNKRFGRIIAFILCFTMMFGLSVTAFAETTDNAETLKYDYVTELPDGGKIYTFVIDGIENNFPVPPEGFNPLTASDETLETYGFPPRPVDKEELTEWKENMAAYKTTPIPEIEQTDRVHGANIPVPNMLTTFSSSDIRNSYSTNWSGYVAKGCTNAFAQVQGDFVQPTIQSGCANNTYESTWVGLGGYNSGKLVQTGTAMNTSGGGRNYYAWYEYLSPSHPNPEIRFSKVTIRPGDRIHTYCSFQRANNKFNAYVANNTNGTSQSVIVNISASEFYDGTTADFINEAPSVGGNTASLTKYGTTNWTNCQVFRTTSTWANLGSLTTESIIMKSKDGNRTLATPSGLSGQTFKSTWNNYS